MNTAIVSGLIILILLVIMLLAGVPIAVALGISSVCAILPVMNMDVAVLTGAQRIFSGISVFSLLAIPFFVIGALAGMRNVFIFARRIYQPKAHSDKDGNIIEEKEKVSSDVKKTQ